MTLAAWLHTLDPFLFRVSGGFGIRWYGLSYAAGFLIAWVLLKRLARRGLVLIPPERIGDAIIVMALGAVIGGRLGYVLFYRPELLWTFEPRLPWWGVLDVASGGMASHGGMIGVIVGAWRVSRGWKDSSGTVRGRTSMLHVLDASALVAPFGLFLGRIANFINGELLGAVVAEPGRPSPWWSVKFPQEVLTEHAPPLSPEQADRLQALVDRVALPTDTFFDQKYERLLAQIQQGAPDLARDLEPLLAARYPSQLFQAAAEGIVLGAVLWWVWRRPRLPGVVGCWFMITYGVLRIITELWRLPDGHLSAPRLAGLSRGQWLSVAMVGVGLLFLWWIVRRGGQKVGGWGGGSAPYAPARVGVNGSRGNAD
jgi:phosphatidylglycerol---prolipoprotein diacylglyceryl transferase